MLGIAIGVHEGDRDRLDAVIFDQLTGRRRDRGFVERQQHLTVDIEPLGHFEPAMARHQDRRRFEKEVVEVVADLASDLDDVAEALRRDQADLGAGALDHGVGHQRGAVHDAVQIGRAQTDLAQQPLRCR